ncbi:MAG: leucine-rich repeat domain-containing protein [Lachnospiraceae bacterium]|nr:leucine-rich repeat domain-containing protein [Lachnospiraceae bacterium]
MNKKILKTVFFLLLTAVLSVLPLKCVYADGVHKEEFMNDDAIISVSIDPDFTYVGNRAYYGCVNLESVVIPEGVTRIGESAFAMCPNLSYVRIPSTVKTIEPGAFAGDTALSSLDISPYNDNFILNNGVLYDDQVKKVISFLPGNGRVVYHMPDSVKTIYNYAFWGNPTIEKVVCSKQVTTISPYDFAYCSGLKYVYMPSFIKSVQEYAFRDCKNLEYLYFGYKNVAIDDTAFYNCGGDYSTVSGANADTFNAKFDYGPELEKAEVILTSSGRGKSTSGNSASGNSASGNSASGNSASFGSGLISGSGSQASSVGKWDPDTTTYVTRNPYIKSAVDRLSQRLRSTGINPDYNISRYFGPLINLPQ